MRISANNIKTEQLPISLFEEIKLKYLVNLHIYLNKIILWGFYILIFISILYLFYGILYVELYHKFFTKFDYDSFILEFAERIFIYFLPLFIIAGFYTFYSETLAKKLLTNNVNPDPYEAFKLLDISKSIFLSSILSYTLIKIIEILNEKNSFHENLYSLISYGVFLLLLMIYILLHHISSRSKIHKVENKTSTNE